MSPLVSIPLLTTSLFLHLSQSLLTTFTSISFPKNNSISSLLCSSLLCFHFIITISPTTNPIHPFIKITSLLVFRMSGGKTLPGNLETRSIFDEFRSFDTGGCFDLGHPLLNRIAHSFIKAAGIGAVQAVSREAYFVTLESAGLDSSSNGVPDIAKKQRLPNFRGENNRKSLEAMVKNTGKESLQWGLAAGMYSGLTYGLKETRGSHDWTNSAVAGAITGATMALTTDDHSHEKIVQYAITGAAISAAANLLTGIF